MAARLAARAPESTNIEQQEANPAATKTSDNSFTEVTSRKSRRRLKKQQEHETEKEHDDTVAHPHTQTSSGRQHEPTTKLTKFDVKIARVLDAQETRAEVYLAKRNVYPSIPPPMPPTPSGTRLFIASLGNPPPYATTRHSAGHLLLKALQSHLQLPPLQKSKNYANGLISIGADVGRSEYTLWQSPSLMNASGVALLKAYNTFTHAARESPADPLPGLVVLYDEMEAAPSQLRVRYGALSPKGHNGLRSLLTSFQSAGLTQKLGSRMVRIGIGIGRPPNGSRSSDDVSQYVLGQLTPSERQGIDGKAAELVGLLEKEMAKSNS